MSYGIKVEGLEKFRFDKADELTRKHVTDAMQKSVVTVVSEVRPLTPVGVSGRLRNSIGSQVEVSQSTVIGRVGSSLKSEEYPAVMELGRRPGSFPPVTALERWVHLKLGVPADQQHAVAFVVARAIAARGIKGYFYLKRGLEASVSKINGFFNDALSGLGKDLTNGG